MNNNWMDIKFRFNLNENKNRDLQNTKVILTKLALFSP